MSGPGSGKRNHSGYSYNNTARLLQSGDEFFDTLEKLIDAAVLDIHFQTYIFSNDETGERIKQALIKAAQRGVNVFLLLDAYGSGSLPDKFIQEIISAGIQFRWFGQLFRRGRFHIGRRLHRKVVVVDEHTSIVSGLNISDNYNDVDENPPWLDFGVLVRGDVSLKIHSVCRQSWLKVRFRRFSKKLKTEVQKELQPVDQPVKLRVRENDRKIGKNQAAGSYYRLIKESTESLTIVGGYFLPGRKARRLLRRASMRGVTIKLIVAERSDVGVMRNAMLYLYSWLLRNSIQIYEYQPSNVHGKVIVADKKIVSIGSYDMNTLSTYSNIELNLDIDDYKFAGYFNDQLEQIIKTGCTKVTEDAFRMRSGIGAKFIRWLSYRVVKSFFVLSVLLAKE